MLSLRLDAKDPNRESDVWYNVVLPEGGGYEVLEWWSMSSVHVPGVAEPCLGGRADEAVTKRRSSSSSCQHCKHLIFCHYGAGTQTVLNK